MQEIVIVPTYKRSEFLAFCLTKIRAIEPDIPIVVFPDRGTLFDPELQEVKAMFPDVRWCWVPEHEFYGNSYNTMEAYRWAYNWGADLTFYVEDDVVVHDNFFKWHRDQHDDCPDLFASMAWVFNRYTDLVEQTLYQPWFYAIGDCFSRKKLWLVVKHASPLYYADMPGYIDTVFKDCALNRGRPQFGIEHYEQDGLIQRVLDLDKSQTASPAIAKCTHLGVFGYNRGWGRQEDFFRHCTTLPERMARIEQLMADEYERVELFGRDIVEREVGHVIPPRAIRYKVSTPEGFESEFTSERVLRPNNLPPRVNSVRVTPEMTFEKIG